jgi:hypothetical protein
MSNQYKYISGKELIGRVSDSFTLDNSQWIFSAPLWIADGIAQLKIPCTLEYTATQATVSAYKCELPCNLKLLIAVEYNGKRLKRLGAFNNMSTNTMATRGYSDSDSYEIVGNNWITTTFEEGDIVFHYRIPPVEYDKFNDIIIPKVPDDAYVIEALQWFIILKLLYKGFKHPVFSLDGNNEFTNPGIQWEKNKKRARNSVNIIDADERENISKLIRKFIQDYNSYDSKFFTPSSTSQFKYSPLTLTGDTVSSLIDTSNVTNTETMAITKYSRYVANESQVYIPESTHKLGAMVIPVFYLKVDGVYTKANTTFTIDFTGNVTWNSPTVVDNGLIILI